MNYENLKHFIDMNPNPINKKVRDKCLEIRQTVIKKVSSEITTPEELEAIYKAFLDNKTVCKLVAKNPNAGENLLITLSTDGYINEVLENPVIDLLVVEINSCIDDILLGKHSIAFDFPINKIKKVPVWLERWLQMSKRGGFIYSMCNNKDLFFSTEFNNWAFENLAVLGNKTLSDFKAFNQKLLEINLNRAIDSTN